MFDVDRMVCRLCKVVFISRESYEPVEDIRCFCGARLIPYIQEDHWDWERIPVSRACLLEHIREEVSAQHA